MTVCQQSDYSPPGGATDLRNWAATRLALTMFLGSYFATVVLGNLIYASPFGADLLTAAEFSTDLLYFPTTFSFGYWLLLLSPLVIVPVAVLFITPFVRRHVVAPIVWAVPDFTTRDFIVLMLAVYGFAAWALWRTDAFVLSAGATDALEAIEARFTLQGRMTFPEKIAIHSIVPFLTFYAVVAATRSGERCWAALAFLCIAGALVILTAINMKWPILVFYIGVLAAVFLFSKRFAYTKLIIGMIGLVAMYLAISTFIFRWAPDAVVERPTAAASEPDQGSVEALPPIGKDYSGIAQASVRHAPLLIAHAVNRMAMPYPYYYKIFTEQGPICGNLIETFTPGAKPCAPTYKVYSTIFPDDGFEGRGSSPAAPHITGYALQGWIGAAAGLVGLSVLIIVFTAIPIAGGTMAATWVIVGAITGYHLSQIPGEGAIIYDHGILWPALLVALYTAFRYATDFRNQKG